MVGIFYDWFFGPPKYFHGGKLDITPEQYKIADDLISQRAQLVQDVANMYGRDLNRVLGTDWLRSEVAEEVAIRHLAKGGHIGFDELAKRVASRYAGKPVPPKYRKIYGQNYSDAEALEVGKKVASKVYQEKYAEGGSLSPDVFSIESFQVPNPNFPDDEWALHYGAEDDCYAAGGAIAGPNRSKAWYIQMGGYLAQYIESHGGGYELFDSFSTRPETNSGIRLVAYVSSWSERQKQQLISDAESVYGFKINKEEPGKLVFVPDLIYSSGGEIGDKAKKEKAISQRWIELKEQMNLYANAPTGYFSDFEDYQDDADFRRISSKKTQRLINEIEVEGNKLKPWVSGNLFDNTKVRSVSELLSNKHKKGGPMRICTLDVSVGNPEDVEAISADMYEEIMKDFDLETAIASAKSLMQKHDFITRIGIVETDATLNNNLMAEFIRGEDGEIVSKMKDGGALSANYFLSPYVERSGTSGYLEAEPDFAESVIGTFDGAKSKAKEIIEKHPEVQKVNIVKLGASVLKNKKVAEVVREGDGTIQLRHGGQVKNSNNSLAGTYYDDQNNEYEYAYYEPNVGHFLRSKKHNTLVFGGPNKIMSSRFTKKKFELGGAVLPASVLTTISNDGQKIYTVSTSSGLHQLFPGTYTEKEVFLINNGYMLAAEKPSIMVSDSSEEYIKQQIKNTYGVDEVVATNSGNDVRFWARPDLNESENALVHQGYIVVAEYDAPVSPDTRSSLRTKIKTAYQVEPKVTGSHGRVRFWVKEQAGEAPEYAQGGNIGNPYAICTSSIGKLAGTTERSKWNMGMKTKYEHCVNSVKSKLLRGGSLLKRIEKDTDLLPSVIADVVAGNVVAYRYALAGKDLLEHEPAFLNDIKILTKELIRDTEKQYESSPAFKKMLNGEGNTGRDFLYDKMYQWTGFDSQEDFKRRNKMLFEELEKKTNALAFLKGTRPNVNPKADYVNAVLSEDFESTDEELSELFQEELGISDEQAKSILSFRKNFYINKQFKLPV